MQNITVPKDKLLEALKKNRKNHRNEFLKAQEAFKAEAIRLLEERLDQAKKGKRVNVYIQMVEPVDQTKEYDRVIAMIEMNIGDTFILNEQDFKQYVMDDWSWSAMTKVANSTYTK